MAIWILLSVLGVCVAQPPLQGYNVDPDSWSVSGISSGACMATQFHVAYSADIMGVGMVAGTPYYCSQNTISGSLGCMDSPQSTNVQDLISQALAYASGGDIDPTSNIQGDKVFIFQGTADTVVYPGNGPNVVEFYDAFGADIQTEFTINAEHGFPTDFYGGPCDQQDPEYINDCNYHGAYEILNHIYGGLTRPTGSETTNTLLEYDQRDFFLVSPPGAWSVDTTGFVYVPTACAAGAECKLHLALHGCEQGRYTLDDVYATQTGYLQVAELNDIIVLFPQAEASFALPVNAFGCWDWWGYNTGLYATKDGGQTLALWRMMRQVSSLPW